MQSSKLVFGSWRKLASGRKTGRVAGSGVLGPVRGHPKLRTQALLIRCRASEHVHTVLHTTPNPLRLVYEEHLRA